MVLAPNTALATQGHGGIEGVYAHQIAHLFFIISMGASYTGRDSAGLFEKEVGS